MHLSKYCQSGNFVIYHIHQFWMGGLHRLILTILITQCESHIIHLTSLAKQYSAKMNMSTHMQILIVSRVLNFNYKIESKIVVSYQYA